MFFSSSRNCGPIMTFTGVSVDRYVVNDLLQQVYLAARELNLKALPVEARNWINERLKYTHGFGVVMTPAAQGGEEPITWFIQGIPPTSDYGFKIDQPAIYYGRANYAPVIAPNSSGEMGFPWGDTVTNIIIRVKAACRFRICSVS